VSVWLIVLSAVNLISSSAPAALVIFPSSMFLANLPYDTAILNSGWNWLLLESDSFDSIQRLYRAGAYIILPGGLTGCFLG